MSKDIKIGDLVRLNPNYYVGYLNDENKWFVFIVLDVSHPPYKEIKYLRLNDMFYGTVSIEALLKIC